MIASDCIHFPENNVTFFFMAEKKFHVMRDFVSVLVPGNILIPIMLESGIPPTG